jgi:potassium channel
MPAGAACVERALLLQADYNGRTTLHLAVSENRTDVVSVLLEKGAKVDTVDTWGNTALSDGLTHHRLEICKCLVGARMDANQFTHVMDAAENDWPMLSLMCLKGGVDPNSADYDQRSVMHVAAATGNLRAVQGLLQVGANVNIQDRCAPSPFRPLLPLCLLACSTMHHALQLSCCASTRASALVRFCTHQ